MTNPSMPGLVKIGFTERTVEERLEEANMSTWIPTPFSVTFAKFVRDPNQKEQTIHRILVSDRVNPKREFFSTSPDQVRLLFELVDGPWWDPEGIPADPDARLLGDEVIRQFLDKHIYPGEGEAVTWGVIAAAFQTWKREQGYSQGSAVKLREVILDQFGKPNRGEGWSTFTFRRRRNSVVLKL
jgi:hypothetical protein